MKNVSAVLNSADTFFISTPDLLFSHNACVSRSACAGHLCAKIRACEYAHKWTARALSAARTCYAHFLRTLIKRLVWLSIYFQSHSDGSWYSGWELAHACALFSEFTVTRTLARGLLRRSICRWINPQPLATYRKLAPLHFSGSKDFFSSKKYPCLLYTSPSPRDKRQSRMPSSA